VWLAYLPPSFKAIHATEIRFLLLVFPLLWDPSSDQLKLERIPKNMILILQAGTIPAANAVYQGKRADRHLFSGEWPSQKVASPLL